MPVTLGQAIRNAIESERAAEQLYGGLAGTITDAETRALLERMAAEERQHAAGLALVARQLGAGELPERADAAVRTIETAPAAAASGDLDVEQTLQLALEAEESAALFYDALAGSCEGATADFFARVSAQEEGHAARLRRLIAERGAGA